MLLGTLEPDLLLLSGNVHCMDRSDTRAEAVAVKHGRILAIGSNSELRGIAGPTTRTIDLGGRCVLPGFIDGHVHAEWYGRDQQTPSLKACKSEDEAIDVLRRLVSSTPPGEWVVAAGVPIRVLAPGEGRVTRKVIDQFSADHPILIDCASAGHYMWINGNALKRFNISATTWPAGIPNGDGIVRDAAGEPTGRLEALAWNWGLREIKPHSTAWYEQALEIAQRDLLKVGITSAHSAFEDPFILNGSRMLEEAGRLRVRTFISIDIERYAERFITSGIRKSFGSDMLKVMQLKLILNVPPLSAVYEDYCGMGHRGKHLYPPEWVDEQILRAVQSGWSVCAHVTGDRDTDMVITAFERALDWYNKTTGKDNDTLRLRLEHTTMVTPALVCRIAAAKILVNVRPCGRLSPGDAPGGPHEKMLGNERWRLSRPIKLFLDAGISVNFGCDYPAPCGFLDPCASIFAAIGGCGEPWDTITREQAIRAYTADGAFSVFAEKDVGSLEPGKFADIVVFSADPFTLPVERIWDPKTNLPVDMRADYTVVGGEVVYERA
jgi:hypothetical protein